MTMARFARWALGMYPPSAPDDIRLTDVEPIDADHSRITSRIGLSEEMRQKVRAFQDRHHAIRNQLQSLTSAYDAEVREREMMG